MLARLDWEWSLCKGHYIRVLTPRNIMGSLLTFPRTLLLECLKAKALKLQSLAPLRLAMSTRHFWRQ